MSRQELRYRGPLDLGDGAVHAAEGWVAGDTAVAFEDGQKLAVMHAVKLGATDDRRITFSGDAATWQGVGVERVEVRWDGATLTHPSGTKTAGATVAWSQHGVLIATVQEQRFLPGARVEMVGQQRWIVDGEVRILADSSSRGCGCGG